MYIFSPQFFSDLTELLGGPAHFRYILQPIIAIALGIRDGRLDSRAHTPPYFLDLIRSRGHRREIFREGFHSIVNPFWIAVAMDMIVQFMILRRVHIPSAILTGIFLIALPYLFARGLSNRVETHERSHRPIA